MSTSTIGVGPRGFSGKSMQVRDTYVSLSLTKYTDLGEYQSDGVWKKLYNITCTKTHECFGA